MKNIFRIGWLIAACLLAVASCSKGDTDDGGSNNGGGNPPTAPTITLNKSSITFDEIADEEEVSFTSSADWIAEIINDRADSWLSVSPTSGVAGDAKIKIKANNNDSTDERSASVRIKAGSAQKTINVTQKQKDALTVTSSKFEVTAEGGEVKIEVKANINFEYEIDASAKDWVKYEGTRAMKTSTLTFSVAENDDTEKREAKITIKSGEFNEVVTIYQAGAEPSIVISKNEYVVSSDGETIAVEVASNVDVTVELPTDVDWIKENITRATSTNTYYFDIATNEGYDQRSAEIKFTNKKNNLSEVVTIAQVQKDALVVAKECYTVDSEGDQIQIEVGHNVDFDVEISADWITKADNTRAFVTETLTFNIASNPTNDNREGTIIFKSKDGNISQIVKVYQAQEDALIISKKDIVVSDESGTLAVELQTNVEFKVSDPNVTWLRAVVTRGLTTHTLHYEYDANTSYDSREAQIVVTDTKNNKSETIIITQAQKDAIVLAKSEYEYGAEGGNLDFEIQTNVDINVTISDNAKDWIQQVETRGLETKSLYFNVAAFSGDEDREGTITISGGSATQTIIVKQSGLKEILEKEREALIAFYNAMNGDNWTNNENWCSDKPINEWYGVYINTSLANERCFAIDLSNNNLQGSIPSEIGVLSELRSLTLTGNNITGEIPQIIGNFTKIESLNLSNCLLTGEIPKEIGECTNLTNIQMNSNRLSGNIPNEIGELTQLRWLHISDNNLSGCLPSQIGECINLESVWLMNNNLTGEIPSSIGNCIKLHELNLQSNEFSGEIPKELGYCTSLQRLYLLNNKLSGCIPVEIGNMDNIKELWLQSNSFSGEIPSSIGNLQNLETLYLYKTNISGNIPESISMMPSLKILHLGWNNLSGEIPSHLGNCPALEELALYSNQFLGEIPKELGNIKTLKYLHLGENQLSGAVPKEISQLQNLKTLSLASNQLTGVLPEEIVNLHSLQSLYLNDNMLNGECSDELSCFIENLGFYNIDQKPGYELKLNFYNSTDFSNDGKVITLQEHTKGPGIKFVITIDGFTDKHIADGTANIYIQKAFNAFFSQEPYISFRDYFDVYSVLTVSVRGKIGTNTALGTSYGNDDLYNLDYDKIESYVKKVPAINSNMSNTHIVTILNDMGNWRANCGWTSYGSISCVNIVEQKGAETEIYERVIQHEVLGHGFGRLGDEYVEVPLVGEENYYLDFPEDAKPGIWNSHKDGWYLNVDVTGNSEKVVWKDFLSNKDYATEDISIYEGALLYEKGAYRATFNSIMRDNSGGFNAPSRWAIYKHIMEIAGEDYSFETFLEYDKKNLVQTRSTVSKSAPSTPIDPGKLGAKPVFINR